MNTKKAALTIEIDYDPEKTDPEGLACAMDRLLETALSTPDILEEYGNPAVGEFFVAEKKITPPKPRIVLNISSGVLQEVFASDPTTEAALVDWDVEGSAPSDRDIVEIPDCWTGTKLAAVSEYPVASFKDMLGSVTGAALNAAGLSWGAEAGIAPETQTMRDLKPYTLRIDGQLLRNQRRLLLNVVNTMLHDKPCRPLSEDDCHLFQGVIELLDAIAEQGHDRHGLDCLLDDV